MQALNILLVGDGLNLTALRMSKYLKKLYVTSENIDETQISFNTFLELAKKCRLHQIDLVIVENEKWIRQGIADVLKKNHINCIAINSNWITFMNKSMLNRYEINTPLTLTFPDVPLVVKSGNYQQIANSLTDVVNIQQHFFSISAEVAKNMYLEEFIDGDKFVINAIFDGKNLLSFPLKELNKQQQLMLSKYTKHLENMLVTEKIDFLGFINSKLIWHKNDWYNVGFSFEFPKTDLQIDLIFLLISALYQKLNEIVPE